MGEISEGHKIAITAKYFFDYDKSMFNKGNLMGMCKVQDFLREVCNLPELTDKDVDFLADDVDPIMFSETMQMFERLDEAFFEKRIYEQMLEELISYERYDILAEINKPLCKKGLDIIKEFQSI